MEIIKYPDPRLTAKNEPIGSWTPEIARRVEEMRHVMLRVDGVGIAAPQVGWNVRLFIMAVPDQESGETIERVIFDPTIELSGDELLMSEGCLSFPGLHGRVRRRTEVRLLGKTPEGMIDEILRGFPAQAAQHEMDHLEGMLFVDRMGPAERKLAEPYLKGLRMDWEKTKRP